MSAETAGDRSRSELARFSPACYSTVRFHLKDYTGWSGPPTLYACNPFTRNESMPRFTAVWSKDQSPEYCLRICTGTGVVVKKFVRIQRGVVGAEAGRTGFSLSVLNFAGAKCRQAEACPTGGIHAVSL